MESAYSAGEMQACFVEPYLSRLAVMANDAERCASCIEEFVVRCRGPEGEAQANLSAPVPVGHFGQLQRLQDALGAIDRLASELQTIG